MSSHKTEVSQEFVEAMKDTINTLRVCRNYVEDYRPNQYLEQVISESIDRAEKAFKEVL